VPQAAGSLEEGALADPHKGCSRAEAVEEGSLPVVVDNPLVVVPPVVLLHRGCSPVEGVGNLARHLAVELRTLRVLP